MQTSDEAALRACLARILGYERWRARWGSL